MLDLQGLNSRLEDFEAYLYATKCISSKTANNYQRLITKALTEIGELRPSAKMIYAYSASLAKKNLSSSHIRNTFQAIEAYTKLIGNPIKLGRPKKTKPIIKDILTEAEIILLIHSCKNIKEKALVSTLAYSGIRCEELCQLRICDIDFGSNLLCVRKGKGNKQRLVCISSECTKVLLDYLSIFTKSQQDHLFTARRTGLPLSPWAVRKTIRKIAKRTTDKRVHPHLFRHSLASNMIARGANLLTVKEQLGHRYIETTMIYIQPQFGRVEAEYRLYCPKLI